MGASADLVCSIVGQLFSDCWRGENAKDWMFSIKTKNNKQHTTLKKTKIVVVLCKIGRSAFSRSIPGMEEVGNRGAWEVMSQSAEVAFNRRDKRLCGKIETEGYEKL